MNPKSDFENPKQIQSPNIKIRRTFAPRPLIGILGLEIVSEFEIRISDFPSGADTYPGTAGFPVCRRPSEVTGIRPRRLTLSTCPAAATE
jgi:hypothetical protein